MIYIVELKADFKATRKRNTTRNIIVSAPLEIEPNIEYIISQLYDHIK